MQAVNMELTNDQKIQADKDYALRLATLVPIVREIIKKITDAGLHIGDADTRTEGELNTYREACGNVISYMKDAGVKYTDLNFIFSLVLQPFDHVAGTIKNSLSMTRQDAEEKLLGKSVYDVTLQDLDDVLKGVGRA